ncbi:MAG TPA: LURP-one-related family protein [Lachnospiraceae bacterium]|nr:LURP-one-related family protein [Lachnospiraceae bacterium]
MGFNDAMSGYKKLKNTRGYSLQDLFTMLKGTAYSFGEPALGKVAKDDAIVFNGINGFTVYVKVSVNSIEVARVVSKEAGKFIFKELVASLLTNAQSKDTAMADRAVDELYEVVNTLLQTGVVENKSAAGTAAKLYMHQKVLSIKDKYSICKEDQTPVYWVQGNLTSLGYKIEDAQGNLLIEIKKKLVSIMPEYKLIENGVEIGTIEKKMKLTRPVIAGEVKGESIEIKGDMSGYHFAIKCNDAEIGNVDTERLTWGDVYSIDIKDLSKQDFIVAIAIIVDNIISN